MHRLGQTPTLLAICRRLAIDARFAGGVRNFYRRASEKLGGLMTSEWLFKLPVSGNVTCRWPIWVRKFTRMMVGWGQISRREIRLDSPIHN